MLIEELKVRCDKLRDHIVHRRLADESEVAKYWPAQPEWPLPGVTPASYLADEPDGDHAGLAAQLTDQDPWILAYGHLCRLFGRQEWMKEGSAHASEQVLKALRDEPEDVKLTTGETLSCYPKSFDVLEFFSAHGWTIGWVEVRRLALEESVEAGDTDPESVPEPMSSLMAARREIVDQNALLCWVATTDGVGLPWDPDPADRWKPTAPVPERYYELHPLDVRFIVEAFRRVNYLRLHWLPQLKPSSRSSGTGWEAFWANRAKKTGRPARHLIMRESFASQLAEETLAASTLEDVLGD